MSVVTKLERVLEEERRLLLKADYQQLESLAEWKLKLSEMLTNSQPRLPQELVEKLARTARHNEALLEAAQRGIRAAMTQLREAADSSFQSYSKDGVRAPLSKSSKVRQRI